MEVVELFYGGIPFDILTGQIAKVTSHRQTETNITEGEVSMIIRVLITAMALLLAGYAFWDGALSGGHILNPFGILFLFLSGAVWFGWKPLREIFRSTRDESVIPTIPAGAGWSIKGMGKRAPPPRQSSSS
jgi:hypothetical protein